MKRLIISEEEKNRILGMHLSEQMTNPGMGLNKLNNPPIGKPKTTNVDPAKYLIGKTVNLYFDKENKDLLASGCKITSFLIKENNKAVIKFDKFGNYDEFTYDCIDKNFRNKSGQFTLYNTSLSNYLNPRFCSRSSGGEVVPRADFSSLDSDNTSDIA